MIEFYEGDFTVPLRATFRQEGADIDISATTGLTGEMIAPDGTRTAVTPSFDADAAGDGTDGKVSWAGSAQATLTPGLWSYIYLATFTVGRLSTERIHFRVISNA